MKDFIFKTAYKQLEKSTDGKTLSQLVSRYGVLRERSFGVMVLAFLGGVSIYDYYKLHTTVGYPFLIMLLSLVVLLFLYSVYLVFVSVALKDYLLTRLNVPANDSDSAAAYFKRLYEPSIPSEGKVSSELKSVPTEENKEV